MAKQTDYKHLSNRCSSCAHRLSMHTDEKCNVVTGEGMKSRVEYPCTCGKVAK